MSKRILILLLGLTLLPLSALARDAVEVTLITDRGGALREYPVERRRDLYRAYVEARSGAEYGIRVRNRTNERIGVVIAVDGRNIISGRRSDLRPDERMYVLGPYESQVYRGWRTGRDRVNRFYFTDAGDSYAAAWGDYSAMGVVAVAVYRERSRYRRDSGPEIRQRSESLQAPGTGFGDEERSPSRRVHFEPERHAFERVFLKYEWRETLCRRGVIDCHRPRPRRPHNRFWDEDGYAPYPPGLRRYP